MTYRSIASESSVPLQTPSGRDGAWCRLYRRLQRAADVRPVRTSSGVLFAVVLALVLSSGTLMTTSSKATQTKITKDWVTFFAGTTPPKEKVALLQNGQSFAAVIKAQAAGNPMAGTAAAKVLKVTLTSPTKATVRYTITIGGQPALSNQTGQAVLQGGTWKVGDNSFCALLALEQTKTPACPSK